MSEDVTKAEPAARPFPKSGCARPRPMSRPRKAWSIASSAWPARWSPRSRWRCRCFTSTPRSRAPGRSPISHHPDAAAALHPRRLRDGAVLPVVSDVGAISQPHPLVGRRRRYHRRGDPDLRHRGRRGVHRPRHHADPARRRARRRVHRAAARGDAAHHRLDRAVRGDRVHGLRLFRAVSAAALDAPRL